MERILYIDKCINGIEKKVTAEQAAEYFEVSQRQIKRDIEFMRDRINAPIIYDRYLHAYVYEKEFNDLSFANQDYLLSYIALRSILKNKQYLPVYENNFLTDFEKNIPEEYKALAQKVTYEIPIADPIKPDFFEDICNSLRNKLIIRLTYSDLKNNISTRDIEVLNLLNYSGSWYIIALDIAKNDFRTFKLSRIQKLELTEKKYKNHNKEFWVQVHEYIKNGFGIFFGTKTQKVKVKFTGQAAVIVNTQKWHEKQTKTQDKDSIILEFPAANFTELLAKILSFGSNAQPLSPPELVTLWKDEISKLYKLSK